MVKTKLNFLKNCLDKGVHLREVDDTLNTRMVINALKKTFRNGSPELLNSYQGNQFTSQRFIDFVKENSILQSMDGKNRLTDNIVIER